MNHNPHIKCLPGRLFFPGIAFLMGICLTLSCKQHSQQVQMDESAFVFGTEYIDGDAADYSRPAVITGHIANREVYPKTQEISLVIPFYILIDKEGVIVDFGGHLRPSVPETKEKIDEHIEE